MSEVPLYSKLRTRTALRVVICFQAEVYMYGRTLQGYVGYSNHVGTGVTRNSGHTPP